ncbi:FAD-dependent oxidoreductase [Blastococcus sp. CT_GayMR16]|uniref:FAD-dependent oxidoreductase n=1 Tax=Blastococcus sp. CT_GayMR16 TaxID=2559607 RepID=UPI001ADD70B9|nr:FAD-dependent oxidoreductase [Blastococcus sp. CT_GayMR16]
MTYDVVVLGAGGAGLAAAVSAAEDGARVLLLESEGEIGGSMLQSAGMFTAAGTSVQAAMGVEDSVDRFFQHYMDLNQWRLQPGLIRRFCTQAAPALEWLLGLGLDVPAERSGSAHHPGLCRSGVEDVWRGHVPRDQGQGVVHVLERARRRHDVDLVLHTRVHDLLVADGRVRGVVADGVEVRAGAVVIATGGLAQAPELVARWFPPALAAGDDLFVTAGTGSRGDHLALGEQAGADLAGIGWGLLVVTAYFQTRHHWDAGFPPLSRVYVDRSGLRFMDEDASYAVAAGILDDHGGQAWAIFDEAARLALPPGYADWTPDRVLAEVAGGRTAQAEDLAALAGRIGVPAAALEATLARWNVTLPLGQDPAFARSESLRAKGVTEPPAPIARPPFYAVRMLPAQLVVTHTGLRIDEDARVLDRTGATVPGLSAAGEAGGGVLGPRYVGGGNAVANALTMGRIAGRTAAADARAGGPALSAPDDAAAGAPRTADAAR